MTPGLDPDERPIGAIEGERASFKAWLAVAAVTTGIFTMVTAEQLPVGVLLPVSSALDVSEGTAGLMVTVPGLVAAASAAVLPVVVGRLDRRLMLVGLIALMAAASALSALSDSFAVMLASRFLVGLSIGGFWSIAGTLAARLVPEHVIPRATALIFSGVAAATVLGVPAGTLVGELAGWRVAFAALGGLGVVVFVALLMLLPRMPPNRPVTPGELVGQWRNHGVRLGVIVTFLVVTGQFTAYTFVSPILEDVSGIDAGVVSSLLLAYGVAGIGGNFVAGIGVARDVPRTLIRIAGTLAVVMLAFPLLGVTPVGGLVLLLVWGLSFGGISVTMQTWMLRAAPGSHEAASALLACVFNASIALGALFGGIAVDSLPLTAALLLGGAFMLVTVLTVRSTSLIANGLEPATEGRAS